MCSFFLLQVLHISAFLCNFALVMALSKTRQKLVDVARQLFAKQGFDDTTMNDIAQASGKGRRTLYTYFKNKEEIYYAVIEAEMDRLTDSMKDVALHEMRPVDKIVEIAYTHLRLIKEAVLRNGNLRAEFFRDIWLVEKVRRHFDQTEVELLTQTVFDGVRMGLLQVENIPLTVDILHYSIKGLEVPYIHGRLGEGMSELISRPLVKNLIDRALGR